jgi:L-ascorbate metabolism protein UlaG (beta-lactamase superfamily)
MHITRIVNACVLIELGGDAILTDPYFQPSWFMRMHEPIGLRSSALPKLTAILGGHGVYDHWQPGSIEGQRETPVFVATKAMARKARAAGFTRVAVLEWGETRALSPRLTLQVGPRQTAAGMKVNNYVLATPEERVLVGTEARDLEALEGLGPVDVALLPVDGSSMLGHKLVMNGADALEACRRLPAKVLVPIHYALEPVPLLLQTPGTLDALLAQAGDVNVLPLATGCRSTVGR